MTSAANETIGEAVLDEVPAGTLASESERALIGAYVLSIAAIRATSELYDLDDLADLTLRRLAAFLQAESDTVAENEDWDVGIIAQRLREQASDVFEAVGGFEGLTALVDEAGLPATLRMHAMAVGRAAERRRERDEAVETLRRTGGADVAEAEHAGPCSFHPTDSGNAEAFAALYGHRCRYDYRRGRWLLFKGHTWHADADGAIDRLALQAARARLRGAADLDDRDEQARQAKWAIRSEAAERRTAALRLARSERPIADDGSDWDGDSWLLGVSNGVIDLRTGRLRRGRAEDRITLAVPWPFNPDAKAPRWERFVSEILNDDPALADWVHRAIGYTVTGSTREQIWFLAHGGGSNGKSTFFETLRHVLGPLAVNTAFSTFEYSARQQTTNDLAALAGKRLVTAAETHEGARLNESRIKNLTGSDTMTARFLYAEFFEFRPSCKVWLSVNHRPRVDDDSEGFWRRMREVPFDQQFLGADADEGLLDTLKDEVEGVLAWCVRGALAWQKRPLTDTPPAVTAAVAAYRAAADPLADFVDERCVLAPTASASAADLYRAYQTWADDQGLSQRDRLKKTGLGRRLGDRFRRFRPGRRAGVHYEGVGLTAQG